MISSQDITQILEQLKQTSPLVHNITNYVAMNTAANVLLASGASPAMVHAIEEAPDFTLLCSALTINTGTLSSHWLNSMLACAQQAHKNDIPWVLDPVAVGATAFRLNACKQLIEYKPTVIRGNASEIIALSGHASNSKGVDSGDSVQQAINAADALCEYAKVVVVTGEVDYVTDSKQGYFIENGHALMPTVTALGCSLTSLIGAFLGAEKRVSLAVISALCYYGIAGELAANKAQGPGSFYMHFLDELAQISAEDIANMAKVRPA